MFIGGWRDVAVGDWPVVLYWHMTMHCVGGERGMLMWSLRKAAGRSAAELCGVLGVDVYWHGGAGSGLLNVFSLVIFLYVG